MLGTVVGAGNIPVNNTHTKPYPPKTCILVEKCIMNQASMLESKNDEKESKRGNKCWNERITVLDNIDRQLFTERGYLRKDIKDKSYKGNHASLRAEGRNMCNKGAEATRPGSEEPTVNGAK